MKPIKALVDPPLIDRHVLPSFFPPFDYSMSGRGVEPTIPTMPRRISEFVKPWLATANIRGRSRW